MSYFFEEEVSISGGWSGFSILGKNFEGEVLGSFITEQPRPYGQLKLKDLDIKDFCNSEEENSWAIELEMSDKCLKDFTGELYCGYKNESYRIIELLGVHNKEEKERLKLLEYCNNRYKDRFPLGEMCDYISGGTHLLLFGNFESLLNKGENLKSNLLNLPLFCKLDGDGGFYNRHLKKYCNFDKQLGINFKQRPICLKTNLYSNGKELDNIAIEFRVNNVIDYRIVGYYQALVLLAQNNIELKEIKSLDYIKYGDDTSYREADVTDGDILFVNLKKRGKVTGETLNIIKENALVCIDILIENGLKNSAKELRNYLEEYNIL